MRTDEPTNDNWTCSAKQCSRARQAGCLFCERHWLRIEPAVREKIVRAYERRDFFRVRPLVAGAIAALAADESNPPIKTLCRVRGCGLVTRLALCEPHLGELPAALRDELLGALRPQGNPSRAWELLRQAQTLLSPQQGAAR